jgi:hypothetical protein
MASAPTKRRISPILFGFFSSEAKTRPPEIVEYAEIDSNGMLLNKEYRQFKEAYAFCLVQEERNKKKDEQHAIASSSRSSYKTRAGLLKGSTMCHDQNRSVDIGLFALVVGQFVLEKTKKQLFYKVLQWKGYHIELYDRVVDKINQVNEELNVEGKGNKDYVYAPEGADDFPAIEVPQLAIKKEKRKGNEADKKVKKHVRGKTSGDHQSHHDT